jgi:hypothetical protein
MILPVGSRHGVTSNKNYPLSTPYGTMLKSDAGLCFIDYMNILIDWALSPTLPEEGFSVRPGKREI